MAKEPYGSPLTWIDQYWEPAEPVLEAALSLPVKGYQSWLASHKMERTVGVRPSAGSNPLSEYLAAAMGVYAKLQTDGKRARLMLQLTRIGSAPTMHLRLVLPEWTTPLVLEYTAFRVGETSGNPAEKEVSASQAYSDLEATLRRASK